MFTPIIRQDVRDLEISDDGHYTVYLPAYGDKKLVKVLSEVKNVEWQVFSKHAHKAYREKNVSIVPIDGEAFGRSMASASGVLCGAGFETPAEALYLNKKLLVVPMKRQYEQYFNAAGLEDMGVEVLKKLGKKQVKRIKKWTKSEHRVLVHYPDETQQIIDQLLEQYITSPVPEPAGGYNFLSILRMRFA